MLTVGVKKKILDVKYEGKSLKKMEFWNNKSGIQCSCYHITFSFFQVGNHIDVITSKWVAQDAGIGAGVDSYFEYLVKGAIMLQDEELLAMFHGKHWHISKAITAALLQLLLVLIRIANHNCCLSFFILPAWKHYQLSNVCCRIW